MHVAKDAFYTLQLNSTQSTRKSHQYLLKFWTIAFRQSWAAIDLFSISERDDPSISSYPSLTLERRSDKAELDLGPRRLCAYTRHGWCGVILLGFMTICILAPLLSAYQDKAARICLCTGVRLCPSLSLLQIKGKRLQRSISLW